MAYTSDDLENLSPEEKKKKLHDLQMQAVILDSDGRKMQVQKIDLESQVRNLKRRQDILRVELEEKEVELEKTERKLIENEEEKKRVKKKINVL